MMPMRNTLAKTTHRAVDAASLDLTDERTEMTDATKRWLDDGKWDAYEQAEQSLRNVADLCPVYVAGLLTEIDRLCADLDKQQCANPNATTCAKQWEADHQRAALEQHGLADEFPYGPDAIEHVAAALVDARARLDAQAKTIRNMIAAAGMSPADEACRVVIKIGKEAAAAARGEGRG